MALVVGRNQRTSVIAGGRTNITAERERMAKSERKRMPSVFDFDSRWPEVVPVLNDPLVQRALNAGMNNWLEERKSRRMEFCRARGTSTVLSEEDLVRYTWSSERGPWYYSEGDGWCQKADDKLNDSPEWQAYQAEHDYDDDMEYSEDDLRVVEEITSHFYPQPDTPDWFRCSGACHWLSGWNCAVGSLLMPDREWYTVGTTNHRNAIGIGPTDAVFMDILLCNLESPAEIWQRVRHGRCRSLEDELAIRESRDVTLAPEPLLRGVLADIPTSSCITT
jgi:hypothetical protein